jgi:DNA mismatch repair ATPase MutL
MGNSQLNEQSEFPTVRIEVLNRLFGRMGRQRYDRFEKDCIALFVILRLKKSNSNNTNQQSNSNNTNQQSNSNNTNQQSNSNNTNQQSNSNNTNQQSNSNNTNQQSNSNNTNQHFRKESPILTTENEKHNSTDTNTLCVATTHIFWNPNYVDVKIKQVEYFFKKLVEYRPSLSSTIITGGQFLI